MRSKYKKEFKARKKKIINYIKTDYCEFNGEIAFLDLNRLLLANYLEYYSAADNIMQSEESRLTIVNQLKEALAISDRLVEDKYDDSAHWWLEHHSKTIYLLHNPKTSETVELGEASLFGENDLVDNYIKEHPEADHWLRGVKGEWDSDENRDIWKKLTRSAEKNRSKDYRDLFSLIAKNCRGWWD